MANNLDSLRTLLKLKSPTNVTDDPYMARRRNDIVSGVDDMVAEGDSALYRQKQDADKGRFSRESYRNDDLASIRNILGQKQIAHEQQMERTERPLHIKGKYDVEAARAAAEASMNSLVLRDEMMQNRANTKDDRIDARAADTQAAITGRVGLGSPTDQMEKRLAASRSGYKNSWLRKIPGMGNTGRNDYESALVSALTKMGQMDTLQQDLADLKQQPGNTLDEKIANLGADASSLHPYEREWLELQLGQ